MQPGERHGAAQALPTPGSIIGGKYQIVRVIGEGGMGIVFEATHLKLQQRVAVKMLLPEMLAHSVILTRFEREARASGQLRNRHAARVMDVDVTTDGLPYMVMEFLEGHDLQTELDLRKRLPLQEAVDYLLQACAAMIEAHQLGIVHRDLKPANLFLAVEGGSAQTPTRIVKVLDFGISKLQAEADSKLTVAESVIGTAMYMSPEQVRSSDSVDARTDIWALGITLFELLAGRPPWVGAPTQLAALVVSEDAPDVRTHVDVPADVAAIIAKALRRDPRQRFDDVRQLAVALAPFSSTHRVPTGSSPHLETTSSGAYGRVSIRAPLEDARTMLQAPAVSESRMVNAPGTTPGWTQSGQPPVRSRTLLIGFLVAFIGGLAVLGVVVKLWPASHAPVASSATASAPAPPAIEPAVDAAVASVAISPPVAPTASASPSASASASASVPGAGGSSKPAQATPRSTAVPHAAPPTPPRKPPVTAPTSEPAGNPIHL